MVFKKDSGEFGSLRSIVDFAWTCKPQDCLGVLNLQDCSEAMGGELVKVPDLLRAWPWQRHLNDHYEEAKAASLAWVTSFRAFDAKSQDAFDRCDFGPLSERSYAMAPLL